MTVVMWLILVIIILALCTFFLGKKALASNRIVKEHEGKIKSLEKQLDDYCERFKAERELFHAMLEEKDKLKVEADEKKRKIRTGNKYDNYINGLNQLRDNAAEETTMSDSKS